MSITFIGGFSGARRRLRRARIQDGRAPSAVFLGTWQPKFPFLRSPGTSRSNERMPRGFNNADRLVWLVLLLLARPLTHRLDNWLIISIVMRTTDRSEESWHWLRDYDTGGRCLPFVLRNFFFAGHNKNIIIGVYR